MIDLEEKFGLHIVIDYFAATFPFISHENDFELKIIEDILMMVSNFLGYKKEDVTREDYAQNRFQYQYIIGNDIILRLCGPKLKSGYKSCSIELKGQGCRSYENNNPDKTWQDLFEFFLVRMNAATSRFDVALDDYSGKRITIHEVKRKLDQGLYTTSFREKDYTLFNSKKGMTLQFGSRTSTQMLVIYEKLKEQLSQGIPCKQKYWVRYEMRFYKEKAHNICMNILKNDKESFRSYILGLLYDMLDLKEASNLGDANLYKAKTYIKWRKFLEDVKKAKIEKYKIRISTHETYYKWGRPLAALFFLNILIHQKFDIDSTVIAIVRNGILAIDTIDQQKLKKLNQFLKESGLKKITISDLEIAKEKLEKYIETEELPF
ncbi:MAG: replication initiation factor domain-containing protein [Firmicutes bacterium]|nr:replication initiation factor domain-containing protein [Bacillota bacterium]